MSDRVTRHRGLLPAAGLLLLLAAFAGVLAWRAVRREAGPAASPGEAAPVPSAAPAVPGGLDRDALARLLGPPEDDLPPGRFSERVDGADVALRRAGCLAIVAWRLAAPVPADLELYVFRRPEAARAFLRDRGLPAGRDRAAEDGVAFLRTGRCAVLGIPDDPAAARVLAADRLAGLAPGLAAAGCGEPPR